tara:strand:- start:864 stop:1931 length:1068 start_codon:yes stop_codon:yes gene_type:complete
LKVSIKNILYLLIFFCSNDLFSAEIVNLRFGSDADKNRVVIDITDDTIFSSKVSGKEVKIKFKNKIKTGYILKKNKQISSFKFLKETNEIQIIFKKKIYSHNIYLLKKKKNKFSRIVIDYKKKQERKKVIVIDAGHGGKDSGAVGLMKNLEKNITLEVALLLKKHFSSHSNFKVILTRNKDQFLKLRDRTKIAKMNNADVFISLHADFHRNRRTRGISLYTLSENASDKEAAALARRENRSDLIGSVDLSSETSEVTNILIDLTKRDTLNQSSHLVNFLIKEFKNDMNLLQRTHRFAGFAVLKSLDIPSVLIEMGYLSNKEDSKLLVNKNYQKKISRKIVLAVKNYFNWKDKNNN